MLMINILRTILGNVATIESEGEAFQEIHK